MKTTKLFLAACLLCIVAACNDDDDSSSGMTSEEAADVVGSSLAINASGFTAVVNTSVEGADDALAASDGGRTAACGYSNQLTFSATNLPGAIITYSCDYGYSYILTCGNDVPQSLAVNTTYDGQFDAPRLASQHSGTGNLTITALDETATSYIINGEYNRTGAFQSKIRNKNASNSTVNFSIDDLTVDKTSRKISGGSASVTMTGSVTGKGSFSYTATVVFQGDGTAKVTINGTIYIVDLTTGTAEAA